MGKIVSEFFEKVSKRISTRLLIVFTKSDVCAVNRDLYFTDSQVYTKEALPVWIMPPILLCKDNTF